MATRLTIHAGGAEALPDIAVLLSAIPSLPRPMLARLTEKMIDRIDELDGDPDVEMNGDEQDYDHAEDEPFTWRFGLAQPWGPGCPICDPDAEHDGCEQEDGF